MNTTNRCGNEFKQRAIRPVETTPQDGKSEWTAIQSVSGKLGSTPESLPRWIRRHQRDQGSREGLTSDEHARLI